MTPFDDPSFWIRKLFALLHDPPEKAYDFGPHHKERAQAHLGALGLDHSEPMASDWGASAADRFIAPKGSPSASLSGEEQFFHPFSGREGSHLASEKFPKQKDAEEIFSDSLPDFKSENFQKIFWNIWRLWMPFSATHKDAQSKNAEWIPYLPADTRIPDHSIWHHTAVTSAIEATCPPGSNTPNPAFFLFQVGPVQDFIAQAQSTRDLWSGSYLLSWLIAHAMKKLADVVGPDCIISPSLRGQPLYDWLERKQLKSAKYGKGEKESISFWEDFALEKHQELPLTPSLPNRFLAVVPTDFDPKIIEDAFMGEWRKIAAACRTWLKEDCKQPLPEETEKMWNFQIENHWQITWSLHPWQDVESTLTELRSTSKKIAEHLQPAKETAFGIPEKHQDNRCYKDGKLNPGWAWSGHYELCQALLDARRQTRNFSAWEGRAQCVKDALSGKEEAIVHAGEKGWLKEARENHTLKHLFRSDYPFGAPNLVKRVWHLAYLTKNDQPTKEDQSLNEDLRFDKKKMQFQSVPGIAAAPWRKKLFETLKTKAEGYNNFTDFKGAVEDAKDLLDFKVPDLKKKDDQKWIESIDSSVFQTSFWENLSVDDAGKELRDAALNKLRKLLKKVESTPQTYYAVLALDGDSMGKWLSGAKTPKIREIVTQKTVKWFEENVPESNKWLDGNRPISPGYHLQLSEALGNFSLYCVRRIVRHHGGELVYSGGDDVLALLPADEALDCAKGLKLAFQGSTELSEVYPDLFKNSEVEGFVKLNNPKPSEPSWPFLVPGPRATVSAGIAIAHIKEPLQDLIQEARLAEGRAKADSQKTETKMENGKYKESGWERNAISVTLFKRSGEQVHWGTKFDSSTFDLLDYMKKHFRPPIDKPAKEMPISGKFPYRVCSLLSALDVKEPLDQTLVDIALAEVGWAITQNTEEREGFQQKEFLELCKNYLESLQNFKTQTNGKESNAPRPLQVFTSFFAMEAFLARQGDIS